MKKNYTLFNLSALIILLSALFLLIGIFSPDNSTVIFEDYRLEQAVRDAIGKEEGAILTEDVDLLQELDATGYEIESLEGIQSLSELRILNLEDNFVEDVSALASLIKLEKLNLRNNGITDLEKINFDAILFLDLNELRLRHNVVRDEDGSATRLSDITLLGHLTSLRKLDLRDNHVEDLTPISNLRKLEELDLRENKFDTIEALEPLYQLKELNLRDNRIDSLEPLRYLTNITYLNIHSVKGIESLEPLSNLVNLETLIMEDVSINNNGAFLNNMDNLQNINAIDTGIETIDKDIVEELLRKGALKGEVRPERLLYTLETPTFSKESGFYDSQFSLEIESPIDNSEVYYTLDGSEPSQDSHLYINPIPITPKDNRSLTIVRAKTFSASNTSSETATYSYFINSRSNAPFDLPVLSLVTDPKNLYSEEMGILMNVNAHNRGSDWERPIHLDFFEPDGELALRQNLGVRVHGGASRSYKQKSLRLYADDEYDAEDYMNYDFFQDLNKKGKPDERLKQFKRIILRNSGNDWEHTMFNDALMHSLSDTFGTVDTQAYRPAVLFINGKYSGIQNIRERQDEYYFKTHYDIAEKDLVILENKGTLYRGGNSDVYHYQMMIQYIEENGLENDVHYDYIQTLMDTENFLDYFASQIYFGNRDWPHNNIKFWRKTTDAYIKEAPYGHDGRWRWILFDTDHGFYFSDNPFGAKPYPINHHHNTIDYVMSELDGRNAKNIWPNFLFRSLMENKQFKIDFLNRMNDLLNSSFSESVAYNQVKLMSETIRNEMPYHIERWGAIDSMEKWEMYLQRKYTFANERPELIRRFIIEEFSLDDTINISVENETESGYIRLNTIDINFELPGNKKDDIWVGRYFSNIPITLEAIPKEGYTFSHWEGIDSLDKITVITPSNDLNIRAVFTK